MVFSQAPKEMQEYIKDYYKKNFGIDIEKYNNQELKVILKELNDILVKKIKIEKEKIQRINSELELDMMNLDP